MINLVYFVKERIFVEHQHFEEVFQPEPKDEHKNRWLRISFFVKGLIISWERKREMRGQEGHQHLLMRMLIMMSKFTYLSEESRESGNKNCFSGIKVQYWC